MKNFFKKILGILMSLILFSFSFANSGQYIFFYWNWCPHCAKVEKFFDENNIKQKFKVIYKEVYQNNQNRQEFLNYVKKLWLDLNKVWVPFLIIENPNECKYIAWDEDIINFFKTKIKENCNENVCKWLNCEEKSLGKWTENLIPKLKTDNFRSFFLIMIPAAFSDSINPCAFAVMILLLAAILQKQQEKKKVIFAWLLFSLAVFISYLLMWLGILRILQTTVNPLIIKIVVWILWIIVWLANIKDFFWYWKWFVMEVPLSRRPKMKKIINSITSPIGAFGIGLIVSLFLLPCTSWPYFVILWYLSHMWKEFIRWLIYLICYNLIFILPMIAITFIVGMWYSQTKKLMELKEKNIKIIHLIVWILMLWLGIFVLIN